MWDFKQKEKRRTTLGLSFLLTYSSTAPWLSSQEIILPFQVVTHPYSLHNPSIIPTTHIQCLPSLLLILHNLNLKYVLSTTTNMFFQLPLICILDVYLLSLVIPPVFHTIIHQCTTAGLCCTDNTKQL